MINCASVDIENREPEISEVTNGKAVEGAMAQAPGRSAIGCGVRSMHYETMSEAEAMAEAVELNRIVHAGSKRVLYYEQLSHDDAWDMAIKEMTGN